MISKHPLRRSCAFCRARKIKCSNETICEACRRQGADCIYDFESPRPKARPTSQDSSKSDTSTRRKDVSQGTYRSRSSTTGSPNLSPVRVLADDPIPTREGENIAQALERQFHENLSTESGPRSTPWWERISAVNRSAQGSVREFHKGVAPKFARGNVKYTGILSLLTNDLVGLISDQFGSLGCHHVESGGARFFLSGLANDMTQTMFENAPQGGKPLTEYGQRLQTQLIDVWFSVHPLSFLVSKTLLLREIRDGTHDEILLATMLADANFSIGDEVAMARGHVLLRWAIAQLRTRPYRPNSQSPNGNSADASAGMCSGISTRIFSGISTAQALMLLGWNALCSFQIRRATCYIGLAGSIATQIKEHISSSVGPFTSSRINGIDVFDVEKEIVAYLYWTTYSLNLWAFLPTGNGPFSAHLPTSLTPVFLPVTEALSVTIQLDLVSENFSTLQKQKSVIREMWPLAYISSIIAYIYALYPSNGDAMESCTASYQQEAPLLALQKLQQGRPARDLTAACREVNQMLMESIHILNGQVIEESSRNLVLAIYHTMVIHFLFPALPSDQLDSGLPAETIERFCSSTQEILRIFASVADQPSDLYSVTPSLQSSFPDVFCLALDTTARALSHIHAKRNARALLMDAPTVHAYESRLEELSSKLFEMSQHDLLTQGKSLRLTRKQLKTSLRAFGECLGSESSVASSPGHVRGSASQPATPPLNTSVGSHHFIQGTTSVCESTTYFTAPLDPTASPSSSFSPGIASWDAASSTGIHTFSSPDDLEEPEWSADDMFPDVLDHSLLDEISTVDHFIVPGVVEMQDAWFPQMQSAMDLDMTGPMVSAPWNWVDMGSDATMAATAAAGLCSDMDPVLYYFEGGHYSGHHHGNKRP